MKLRSHIDFPAFVFQKYNNRKELMAVATVSALFTVDAEGVLRPVKKQRDIAMSDEFRSAENAPDHLFRTSDFVPFRPATDVTALAIARSPAGNAQASWLAGIMVGNEQYVLRVHGPRHWFYDKVAGWKLSDAKPVTEVPLDYYGSYGGDRLVPEDHDSHGNVDIWNPVGPGVVTHQTSHKIAVTAPQIEHVDTPIIDALEVYQPQGFAPIAPVWRFRERFVGTYDATWLETQHPFLPPDFDPRFYNAAHPALQFDPYLRGDELIRVANMFPGRPDLAFYLPHLAFGAVATHDSGQTVKSPMVLDGVHLELLEEEPQVRLTWRMSLPWRDGVKTVDIGPLEFSALPQRDEERTA